MWTDKFDKDELAKKIEMLTYLEKDIKESLEELNKALKAKEEEENSKKWWEPKKDEKYYYIDSFARICYAGNNNCLADNDRIALGNSFKTKEEAERRLFELTLHHKLEKFAYENNDREINWEDDSIKYHICYDYSMKLFYSSPVYVTRDYGQVYFSSEEIAEKAIKTFKYDLIRYFTSNE